MAASAGLYSRNLNDWFELQNQSFLAWVNHYLEPAGMAINDFTTDLSDGIKLIVLLEILTGTKFTKYVKNPRFPAQKLANISEALNFMAKKFGIKFIGCNSQDIMEGKRSQCMGVIFLLINKFKTYSLESNARLTPETAVMPVRTDRTGSTEAKEGTISAKFKPTRLASKSMEVSPAKLTNQAVIRTEPSQPAPEVSHYHYKKDLANMSPVDETFSVSKTIESLVLNRPKTPGQCAQKPPIPPRPRHFKSVSAATGGQRMTVAFQAPLSKQDLIQKVRAYLLGYCVRVRYRQIVQDFERVLATFASHQSDMEALVMLQALVRRYNVRNMPSIRAKRRRNEVAKEIMTTEATYVQSLHTLVDVYMKNLEMLGENVISMAKLRTIFSEIKVILSYNQVILGKINNRMENWYSSGQQLGDIFIYLTDFLKVYTAYVNNYDASVSALQDLACNASVNEVLQNCRNDPKVRGMELSSYLIMPIQRIPRYVLLLSDLFKNTPENHPDYPNLMNAQKKMEAVARYVNQKKREAENLLGVATILRHLTDLENANEFNQPHRRYVRFGQLFEIEPGYAIHQKSLRTRYYFLFNDLLLCAKEQTGVLSKKRNSIVSDVDALRISDIQFRCLYMIELMDLIINEIPEISKVKNIFELVIPAGRKIVLVAPTSKLKGAWIGDLDEMIMKCLENYRSRVEISLEEEQAYEKQFANDSSLRIPTFTGTLFKRNQAGDWKKKHFVLIGDILYYYTNILSSMNESAEPKGKIYLLFASVTFLSVMDRHFCFQLCLKSKVYYLSADSAHTRLQWINVIRAAISKHMSQVEYNQRPHGSGKNALSPPMIQDLAGSSVHSPVSLNQLKHVKNIGDKRRSLDIPDKEKISFNTDSKATPSKALRNNSDGISSQKDVQTKSVDAPMAKRPTLNEDKTRMKGQKENLKRKKKKLREAICELRTGELYKYSYGSTKITKYRMVLTSKNILYYRGNHKKPSGMVDLLLIRPNPQKKAVSVTIDELTLYEFTLLTPDRNVVLASESEEEANGWSEDIHEALANLLA